MRVFRLFAVALYSCLLLPVNTINQNRYATRSAQYKPPPLSTAPPPFLHSPLQTFSPCAFVYINAKYSSSLNKCTQTRSATDPEPMTTQQKTLSTMSSSSSSSDSSGSEPSDTQALRPPVTLGRSISGSNRQSVFLGHGDEEIVSSRVPNSNDDQEDMKEVEIETEDPSHLFWVSVQQKSVLS